MIKIDDDKKKKFWKWKIPQLFTGIIYSYTTKLFFFCNKNSSFWAKIIIIIMYLHNTHTHIYIVKEIIPVYCTWLVTINFIHNFHFVSFLPSSLPLGSFFFPLLFCCCCCVVLCLFSHHFFFYLAPCVCMFRNSTTLNQNNQNTFHW